MKKFVEITHSLNKEREMGKAFIQVADIVGIKEESVPTDKLYDEDGNVVQETSKGKIFAVLVANPCGSRVVLYVEETEYQRLVALLDQDDTTTTK